MGRERQKAKKRSSIPKTKPSLRGRTKHGKKKVNFLGNAVVAENWDRDLTLLQNYQRLGLTSRLRAATGGVEKKVKRAGPGVVGSGDGGEEEEVDKLAMPGRKRTTKLVPGEVRVERDPETGRILRVIRPESGSDGLDERHKRKRLDDPLNSDSGCENEDAATADPTRARRREPATDVVAALEAQAAEEAVQLAKRKRPRQQSKREEEWIATLVAKYGDNTGAMARDRRLNPMQQTEADIGRRVMKWRDRREEGSLVEAIVV
ncbi:hypothetical protein EPUS_09360 [Endocarpon pusillum Z07020]|uniref:Nucleolar protein 16 n=1 Tax=Endocarpon pusillum (strain Z07020 / HMAS-L-300199) TaxID=1263415 RepID=U1HQQ4_ENDPU|nr:uncharacterized protein EPUS_09360 [Endocarpon pusillum Z07020]ERF72770.1 hypothetical protein EPUS_09360 [Endocarpon pusillum Z07020]